MDDLIHTSGQSARKPRRHIHMAYTLNNVQPVLCTILSDQPYFYMDEAAHEEDEMEMMDQAMDRLERDIADLNHKMSAYETMSAQFLSPAINKLDEFRHSAEEITGLHVSRFRDTTVQELKSLICQSRMTDTLWRDAEDHGVIIQASAQVETALFDKEALKIFFNPALSCLHAGLMVIRELRRHYQFRTGALLHPLTFQPDEGILVNRAQRADLSVAMVRAAWELQLAGEKDMWVALEQSSMADLARAFAREAFADFRTLNNGQASAAVFETWFLSERCRVEDKKLIQAMLADYRGYVFGTEQVSRHVSAELLGALGSQPFGKNYLAGYAQMIMTDPVFTEVRDRSNANFLWFIKFERSFRETEQELHISESLPASGLLPEDLSIKPGDKNYDLSADRPLRLSSSTRPGTGRTDTGLETDVAADNVIYVAFGTFRSSQGEAV
ncbi:MAG: hypothetical protein J0L77_01065 [Alphaproteobacteria bacterium]|nr:hypothetical protein [Alphaproteobacteria bacterium]